MRNARRREYRYKPVDTELDVAIGIKLPFNKYYGGLPKSAVAASGSIDVINSSSDGIFNLSYTTEEQSRSNILLLLLTTQGERLMHPKFGTRLRYFVFENKTDFLKNNIIDDIKSAISYWLPYIVLSDFNVDFDESEYGIKVTFKYKVTKNGALVPIVLFVNEDGIDIK